jgi:DNA-binding SARP family transcriptional activator
LADGRLEVGWVKESPFVVDAAVLLGSRPDRATLNELMQAARAYSGEFLPGFYDEWVSEAREQIAVGFEQIMNTLITRLSAEQRWPEMATWANFWISRSRECEEAYRALMQAQAATNDRSAISQTYARCQTALQETLGVEPAPATTELFRQLRGDKLAEADTLTEMRQLLRELRRRAATLDRAPSRAMPLIESLCALML